MGRIFGRLRVGLTALFLIIGFQAAYAQTPSGCSLQQLGGTSRQILRCNDGITVTAEAGARYKLLDHNRDGVPDAVSLAGKAILVDVDRAKIKGGFEVVTPQAIAAVRGTRWAVDVNGGKTSVLVVRGSVAVHRPNDGASVVLGRGQGVDVVGGNGPLIVKRWPQGRVAALLARLGQ